MRPTSSELSLAPRPAVPDVPSFGLYSVEVNRV